MPHSLLKLVAWIPLKLGETATGGRLAAWMARHAPRLLPVRVVALNETTFAMLHPLPQYPDHVVITPRTYVPDLCALVARGHVDLLREVIEMARELDRTRPPGGRLFTMSNGERLHVQHIHGHLASPADAFWLDSDTWIEVASAPREDAHAVLRAVGDALARVGGCDTVGSLVFEGLQADELRIAITVAPSHAAS